MLTEQEYQTAAEALYKAEAEGVLADPISSTYPGADIAASHKYKHAAPASGSSTHRDSLAPNTL